MKIGVYQGSFNPFHNGHKEVIDTLVKKNIVDKVIVIPSMSYWDKKIDVTIEDRINMLKLIKDENIILNTTLNNKEYTYLVLNELSKQYRDLNLIIGADNLIDFDKWKNVNEILNHKVIVISRNNIDINKYLDNFDKSKFIIVDDFNYDISSTYIRNQIKNDNYEALNEVMDPKILSYIKKNRLYRK